MPPPTVTYWAESIFLSKVFWFNAGSAIVAMLTAADVVPLFPPQWGPRVIAIVAVINIALRFATVRPVALIAPGDIAPVTVEKLT